MSEEKEITLRDIVKNALAFNNETWDDVTMHTIPLHHLHDLYDDIAFCEPIHFFMWTENYVYYDSYSEEGFEIWHAPRNPPEQSGAKNTMSEEKAQYVKLVNEHICLIAMPHEIVHSILCAAGGTVEDPSMFGKEHREEVHKQINEVIAKMVPTYTFIDKIG